MDKLPLAASIRRRQLVLAGLLGGVLAGRGLAQPAAAPALPRLRVAGFALAPLVGGEPGEAVAGLLPGYLRERVEPQAPFRFDWLPIMTFARVMRSLRDGSADLALTLSSSAGPGGRSDGAVGRFAWHYLEAHPVLALRRDSPLLQGGQGLGDLALLQGLELAWVSYSRLPPELAALDRLRWQRTSHSDWQLANLRMVAAGRVDAAYYANEFSPAWLLRQHPLLRQKLRLLRLPLAPRRFEMAYSRRSEPGLIAAFERLARPAFEGGRFERYLDETMACDGSACPAQPRPPAAPPSP